MIWGNDSVRRQEKFNEMKMFMPILLSSTPMLPMIEISKKAKNTLKNEAENEGKNDENNENYGEMNGEICDEIFITRADAFDGDSLYQSYLFNLSEDERDSSGITTTSCCGSVSGASASGSVSGASGTGSVSGSGPCSPDAVSTETSTGTNVNTNINTNTNMLTNMIMNSN